MAEIGAHPAWARFFGLAGANLSNFFIHTPICCPSRTTLLSGRYVHNNRVSTLGGGGCMRMNTSAVTNPEWWGNTLPNRLGQAGYTVGLFGKVLNTMTTYGCAAPYDTLPQNVDRLMIMCSVGYVRQLRHCFRPVLTQHAALHHPTCVV